MVERKKRQTKSNTKKPTAPKKTTAKKPTVPKKTTTKKPTAPKKTTAKKPTDLKKQEKIDKKQELINSGFVGNEQLDFHEVFPIKLEHKQKNKYELKICYFQCKEHLDKYISRYKLRKNSYTVSQTPKK